MKAAGKNHVAALGHAVEKMHGARAAFVNSTAVHEQFQGATVWRGIVSEFELSGHPTAQSCYAWSVPADEGHRERFFAVLGTPEIDSPEKAVRASIVSEHRSKDG